MAIFTLKSFAQIVTDMVSTVTANSPITDINAGSVILTLLEASASEDANSYIQMLNIIRAYSLDTTSGTELDDRAYEYGLIRYQPKIASGSVDFYDTAFTRVQTTIYAGLPGPSAGNTAINIYDSTDLPALGDIVNVGRGTINAEVVPYGTITNMGAYYRLNLTAPLTKDHGVNETVILSQGGIRVISAGTTVYVPESDLSNQINFVLQSDAVILDGETQVTDNIAVCAEAGSIGNVKTGAIRYFGSLPFPTAVVNNPMSFTNGGDLESDAELRDRIRDTVQSLSRGTVLAILTAMNQISSAVQNNRVVSTSFVEATALNELNFLYIDDGLGLEPWFDNVPTEMLMEYALGGEKFLQISNDQTPVTKASMVTAAGEPYGLSGGETLTVKVQTQSQSMAFDAAKISIPGMATAEEVVRCINDDPNVGAIVEARTTENRTKVVIEPVVNSAERIEVISGTSLPALQFTAGVEFRTLNLYKNDVILNKDGENAFLQNIGPEPAAGGYVGLAGTDFNIQVDGAATIQNVALTTETTADDVANSINAQISGASAVVIQDVPTIGGDTGRRILITSTNPEPGDSALLVTAGAPDANAILQFPVTVSTGAARDYIFNRYNGQIEFVVPLTAGDEILAGTPNTRAYLESTSASPNIVTGGQELIFQVDDIVDSAVTTQVGASDFIDINLIPPIGVFDVDDHFIRRWVRFKSTTTTVALQGVRREISVYDGTIGQFTVAVAFPAVPAVGDVYEIVQVLTIPGGVPVAYTPTSAQDVLAPLVEGVSFYGKTKNLNTYMRIQTNTFGSDGKIRIHSASTAVNFTFPTDVTKSSGESNTGYVESANESPFTFGVGQSITFVADKDVSDKTVSMTMQVPGTVTTQVSNVAFNASALTVGYVTDDFFTDMVCRFRDTTPTVALRSEERTIDTYDHLTGQVHVTLAYSAIPAVNDLFDIVPRTAVNVRDLFENPAFTNLSTYCKTDLSSDGTKIQISTLTAGGDGAVQCAGGTANSFAYLLPTDATVLGQFEMDSDSGLSIGMRIKIFKTGGPAPDTYDLLISDIVANPLPHPYLITVTTLAGALIDLSEFTSARTSYITEFNQFDFSLIIGEGRDAYKYYIGLVQEAQWKLDGKDTDTQNYPGVKAAGVMIEVKAPVIEYISHVNVDITSKEGYNVISLKNNVISAISSYINTLGVGEDVILSEIINRVMDVGGILDAVIVYPLSNVIIAANEKAKILESSILVG